MFQRVCQTNNVPSPGSVRLPVAVAAKQDWQQAHLHIKSCCAPSRQHQTTSLVESCALPLPMCKKPLSHMLAHLCIQSPGGHQRYITLIPQCDGLFPELLLVSFQMLVEIHVPSWICQTRLHLTQLVQPILLRAASYGWLPCGSAGAVASGSPGERSWLPLHLVHALEQQSSLLHCCGKSARREHCSMKACILACF